MADLIYREDALETVRGLPIQIGYLDYNDVYMAIKKLPPADTERHAHWKWIKDDMFRCVIGDDWICSNCKKTECNNTNYCPHCGCRMDEVSE